MTHARTSSTVAICLGPLTASARMMASSHSPSKNNFDTSGTFGVLNDTGFTMGADSDATFSIQSNNLVITQNRTVT